MNERNTSHLCCATALLGLQTARHSDDSKRQCIIIHQYNETLNQPELHLQAYILCEFLSILNRCRWANSIGDLLRNMCVYISLCLCRVCVRMCLHTCVRACMCAHLCPCRNSCNLPKYNPGELFFSGPGGLYLGAMAQKFRVFLADLCKKKHSKKKRKNFLHAIRVKMPFPRILCIS